MRARSRSQHRSDAPAPSVRKDGAGAQPSALSGPPSERVRLRRRRERGSYERDVIDAILD